MAPFGSDARKRMKIPRNDEDKIGWERHGERATKTTEDTAEILKLDKAIRRNDLTSAIRAASLQELSENHLDDADAAYHPAEDECVGPIRAKTSARASALDKEANKFLGEKPLAPITRCGGDTAIEIWDRERVSGFTRDPLTRKLVVKDGRTSRSGYRRILPESRPDDWHVEYQIEELEDVVKAVLREKKATIFEALVLDPLRGRPGKTIDDLARQFGRSADYISRIKHKCKIRVQAEIEARRAAEAKVRAAAATQADETCGVCGRNYGAKVWPRIRRVGGIIRKT